MNTIFDMEEVETITEEVKQEEVKTTELIDIKSDQIVVVSHAGYKFKDYDSILKQVVNFNNKYKDFVFTTDDDKKKGKKILSTINANKKVLNDMRIKIKKTILKPVDTLVDEIKTITSNYDETTKNIGSQIERIEQKARDTKKLLIEEFFNECVKEYKEINFVALDKIFDRKWYNIGSNIKSIKETILNIFLKRVEDLGNIKLDGDLGARVKRIYLENGYDYSEAKKQAITEVNQERKDQEEIDLKLEKEGLKVKSFDTQKVIDNSNYQQGSNEEVAEGVTPIISSEPQVEGFAVFGVKGGIDDLKQLSKFMDKLQIERTKISSVEDYNKFKEEL